MLLVPNPFFSFAEVSKVKHGYVLGQEVCAPEMAAILFTSGEDDSTRAAITYPKHNPDSRPRFLPLWSPVYESLQYPLLFMHGEAGWSLGQSLENVPKKSRAMNTAGTAHVPLPFYCRQRIISERVFKRNRRIAQKWITDNLPRTKEKQPRFIEAAHFQ